MNDFVSVIIPCYNSSKTIRSVVEKVIVEFNKRKEYKYEIILINDASKDNTIDVIYDLVNNFNQIICIDFSKNFGQHSALMAGFRKACGDYILCMDDDGQTRPSDMFKLIDALNQDFDVVYARYSEKKHSILRNLSSKVNDKMMCSLLKKEKGLYVSSYFIAKKYIIDEIVKYESPYPYILGLILRTTNKITNVDVTHCERQYGSSGYTLKKLISLWFNGFTSFSVLPLRIATLFGFMFGFAGFICVVAIIVNKILNPTVQSGWSSLLSVILLSSGVILIVLGLMGEYIGRSFICLNKAPQYVIRNSKESDKQNE